MLFGFNDLTHNIYLIFMADLNQRETVDYAPVNVHVLIYRTSVYNLKAISVLREPNSILVINIL